MIAKIKAWPLKTKLQVGLPLLSVFNVYLLCFVVTACSGQWWACPTAIVAGVIAVVGGFAVIPISVEMRYDR